MFCLFFEREEIFIFEFCGGIFDLCNLMLWSLSKGKVKPTASIFDDEGGDLFKEKTVALPEATVSQTDEDKARAETKVSRRED